MKTAWVMGIFLAVASAFAAETNETFTSLDKASGKAQLVLPAGTLEFDDASLDDVLEAYQKFSGRVVIRTASLPAAQFKLRAHKELTRVQMLQILDTALAQSGITMIPQGRDMVKAVPAAAAFQEAVPICELAREELPESASYVCYVVELKHRKPRDIAQALQPFAKLPNSIIGIDEGGILILRDYAVNVKRMLQLVDRLEKAPAKPANEAN